jgi:hypothetical protein
MVRNPLEPLRSITRPVFVLVLACYVAAVVSTVIGRATLFGLGSDVVCVNAAHLAVPMTLPFTASGGVANSDGADLCAMHADTGQHVLAVLIGLPGPALFLGALFLLYRVLREAELAGVFGDRVASRLRTLGWFLVAGQLTTMVITGSATAYFVASASKLSPDTPLGAGYWQWSLPTLLAGLGALTFARIMHVGARMREDLDGTV